MERGSRARRCESDNCRCRCSRRSNELTANAVPLAFSCPLLIGAWRRRSEGREAGLRPRTVGDCGQETTPTLMLLVENLNAGGHTELTAQSSLVAQEHANLTRIPNWPGRELGFQVGCSSARDEGRVAGDL